MIDGGRPEARWVPAGFFQLRSALLPFDAFLAHTADASAARMPDGPARADALRQERARSRARLRAWVVDPVVREALQLASPDLEGRLEEWLGNEPALAETDVDVALQKYFARMTGRATPFGLFAGTGHGVVGVALRIEIPPIRDCRRRTTLDSARADSIARAIVESLGAEARVVPAPTLHRVAGRLRYVAIDRSPSGGFRLESLIPDAGLDAALVRAADGATLREIAVAVEERYPDASLDEAVDYARELLARGVVVPELTPALTGDAPLDGLVERASDLASDLASDAASDVASTRAREVVASLEAAVSSLRALDTVPLGSGRASIGTITSALAPLQAAPTAHLVHMDLAKPMTAAELPRSVALELEAATRLLHRLFRTRRPRALDDFRERFQSRYGLREVPLLDALDEDQGIGYDPTYGPNADSAPLLDGLTFPSPPRADASLDAGRAWLLPRVVEVLRRGGSELRIEETEVAAWEREQRMPRPPELPDAYTILAAIGAADDEAVRAGRYRLLHMGAGSQGAALLGRFCALDAELRAHVDALLRAEEALRPDATFAEIVFRPEGNLANVTRRPVLRSHEIIVHGRAGVPAERRIALSDLRLSVRAGRILLRSASLDREILPRMATAFDGGRGRNPAVVRFLSALQMQEGLGVKFSWGPLESLPVLPRVVSGRVVLARARWRIAPADLARIRTIAAPQRVDAMNTLRAHLALPRYVGLVTDDDSALPLDLEDPLTGEILLRQATTGAVLTELFPAPDEESLRGSEGRFMHELVIPFVREADSARTSASAVGPARVHEPVAPPRSPEQALFPGGEWLFAKLYGGRDAADRILTDEVGPWLRALEVDGIATRWFFIRYEDPEPHLRVRVQGDPARLASVAIPRLREAAARWQSSGLLHTIALAEYEPETERFGGTVGLELAERIFNADSVGVARMLAEREDEVDRWQQALLGAHHLLLDLGVGVDARIALLRDVEDLYGAEFHADAGLRAQLGEQARRARHALMSRLEAPAPQWIVERSAALRPIGARLRDGIVRGEISHPLVEHARVHLHLHVNRAMRSSARAQEFVIVGLLRRLTEAARSRGPADRSDPR